VWAAGDETSFLGGQGEVRTGTLEQVPDTLSSFAGEAKTEGLKNQDEKLPGVRPYLFEKLLLGLRPTQICIEIN